MLYGNALNAAGKIGFPVFTFCRGFFFGGQIIPPAELLEHIRTELGITVLDLGTLAEGTFRQQVHAIAFDAETGAKGQTTIGNILGGVIQVWCSRMIHFGCAPGRPG